MKIDQIMCANRLLEFYGKYQGNYVFISMYQDNAALTPLHLNYNKLLPQTMPKVLESGYSSLHRSLIWHFFISPSSLDRIYPFLFLSIAFLHITALCCFKLIERVLRYVHLTLSLRLN